MINFENKDFIIKAMYPYDTDLFTQGIIKLDNKIIISTGHYGKSSIRMYDIDNHILTACEYLDDQYFGEGITYNDKYIIQLTWKEETAFLRNPKTLNIEKEIKYKGEGWGICFDGKYLYMSDGSEHIKKLNNETFEIIDTIKVHDENGSIDRINDLEYYDGYIYANVWTKDIIIQFNPENGEIVKIYDLKILHKICRKFNHRLHEMNGIVHVKDNEFLVTGKNWALTFLIIF